MSTATKATHTAGQWNVRKWGDGKLSIDVGSANTIAILNDNGEETEPNAYLLATAPEMLKALEGIWCPECGRLLKVHTNHEGECKPECAEIAAALAVIRKAKGATA